MRENCGSHGALGLWDCGCVRFIAADGPELLVQGANAAGDEPCQTADGRCAEYTFSVLSSSPDQAVLRALTDRAKPALIRPPPWLLGAHRCGVIEVGDAGEVLRF